MLQLFTRGKKQNDLVFESNSADLPHIDIILSVYNEESVIAKKIESTFDANYPEDKLRFYIGSDSSEDRTDAIIEEYRSKFPQIKFRRFPKSGKIGIINALVKNSASPVLIFTDANVFFDKNTIYNLVKHFKNPAIGLTGGNIINEGYKKEGISFQEKSYLKRENWIKYHEGLWGGVMIGAFGGCFALRRENFSPVPANFLVDDFYITMHVLRQYKKAINELDAIAYEDISNKITEEFRRKARISTGNFQNMQQFSSLLWPPFSKVAFCFFSHKILRWLTPFLMIVAFVFNLFLIQNHVFFKWTFTAQLVLLLIPQLDWLLKNINVNFKALRFVTHFYGMNLALLVGFFKFITGVKSSVWRPTERNQ
ncbi:MAG: glycosyltransferase [Cytophagaceae bacterium]|nr:glycosyltransferase [Cytophagaceae bacterium]